MGSSTDITERKRTEENLRRSEAYLAEAQRVSHTGSFGWTLSSGRIYWSEETFRIFELDPATEPTIELILTDRGRRPKAELSGRLGSLYEAIIV